MMSQVLRDRSGLRPEQVKKEKMTDYHESRQSSQSNCELNRLSSANRQIQRHVFEQKGEGEQRTQKETKQRVIRRHEEDT